MTNLKFLEFSKYVKEKSIDYSGTKVMISVALGLALSRKLPLPSSEVGYPSEHFNEQTLPIVLHKASEFNEQLLVDIDVVSQTARSQWLVRYATAYPSEFIFLSSDCDVDFSIKFSGVAHLVNPINAALCEKNANLMIVLVNRITELLKEFE